MDVNDKDRLKHYCPKTFVDNDGPNGFEPGEWREDSNSINGLTSIRNLGNSNNCGADEKLVREQFTEYFNNEGAVDWQWDIENKSK